MGVSGGGNLSTDVTTGISGTPALQLTSVQYNENGTWGGCNDMPAGTDPGVWYDKNANTLSGQIQLGGGTMARPKIAFSDAVFPGGNYDTGIYRGQATADSTIVAFTIGGNTNSGFSNGIGMPATAFSGVKAGYNVSSTGGISHIRRISGTGGNTSWKDGYFGNSDYMIFTPDDFEVSRTTGAGDPTGSTLTTSSSVCQVTTVRGPSWPCRVFEVSATQIVAMKLLPKGYSIPQTDPGGGWVVKSTSNSTLGGGNTSTMQAFSWKLDPTTTLTNLGGPHTLNFNVAPNDGDSHSFGNNVASIEGDGETFLVLVINNY